MTGDYKQMSIQHQLDFFKGKMHQLRESYEHTSKKFNAICEELDSSCKNPKEIEEKSVELTILMSYIDGINNKIKKINEIIEDLKIELKQ